MQDPEQTPRRAGVPVAPDGARVADQGASPSASTPESGPGPVRRVLHAVRWLLAVAGVFLLFFIAMSIGSMISYSYDAAIVSVETGRDVEQVIESGAYLTADSDLRASIAGQVAVLIVMLPWWLRVRRRSFGSLRRAGSPRDPKSIARAVLGIALAGIGLQLSTGYLLGFVLQFFPDLSHEYQQIMNEAGTGTFSLLSVLTVAVLAPVIEEITCRGLMLEFILRALTPRWNKRRGAEGLRVSPAVVPIAVVGQALVFAVMHGNIVQASYAVAMGALFGWAYWRTGSLAYSMGLHLAINFSSYVVDVLNPLLNFAGALACIFLSMVAAYAGIALLVQATRRHAVPLGLPAAGQSTASR